MSGLVWCLVLSKLVSCKSGLQGGGGVFLQNKNMQYFWFAASATSNTCCKLTLQVLLLSPIFQLSLFLAAIFCCRKRKRDFLQSELSINSRDSSRWDGGVGTRDGHADADIRINIRIIRIYRAISNICRKMRISAWPSLVGTRWDLV